MFINFKMDSVLVKAFLVVEVGKNRQMSLEKKSVGIDTDQKKVNV